MDQPLDELYLRWLYKQVGRAGSTSSRTHWDLFRKLFTTEFIWIVPNDDNRVEDGRELRLEFIEESDHLEVDASWLGLGCSVLEMLIALSQRLSFEAEGEAREWFWLMLRNLKLERFNDSRFSHEDADYEVGLILETLIWRNYNRTGHGGLFPLQNPQEDQRKVEIWYQLSAYLAELD